MQPIQPTLVQLVLLALPATAMAQDSATPAPRWAIGLGTAVIDSPYAGEGSRVRAFPLVSYDGERVFLRGVSGGVHLVDTGGFRLDAMLALRMQGFDIEDLGRDELLANGVDASLLDDRDDGLDAGLRASFGADWGSISLEGLHDVSDASDGYEVSLGYSYTWQFNRTALTANTGASLLSSDLAGYYYGLRASEVADGLIAYTPGSALLSRAGVTLTHWLGASDWQLLASAEIQFLPSELRDSPLLDPDSNRTGRLVLGLSRRF